MQCGHFTNEKQGLPDDIAVEINIYDVSVVSVAYSQKQPLKQLRLLHLLANMRTQTNTTHR